MALDFKYRIHEVAKDFGMTSKDISQILTDYATTPKNHMQVLEDAELDLIFEYLTQHHQVGSIAEIFAPEPEEKKAPAKAPEEIFSCRIPSQNSVRQGAQECPAR